MRFAAARSRRRGRAAAMLIGLSALLALASGTARAGSAAVDAQGLSFGAPERCLDGDRPAGAVAVVVETADTGGNGERGAL